MKIGIIGGIDILPLFKVLNIFDHQYVLFFDQNGWPYGDKDLSYIVKRIEKYINILRDQKIERIIISPTLELYFRYILNENKILPLAELYFLQGLKLSLIGKIGFAGDLLDKTNFQNLFKKFVLSKYELTDKQKNIKKFNKKFSVWIKETRMWKYYLTTFGARDRMVRKTIKTDLKYFKDADIDTFFILNWGYLAYDNLFRKYLKFKKIRYHGSTILKNIFQSFLLEQSKYNVEILVDGPKDFLFSQKKFLYLIQRGKNNHISYN